MELPLWVSYFTRLLKLPSGLPLKAADPELAALVRHARLRGRLGGDLQSTAMQQTGAARAKLLAPTPPMGWNSWDSYGLRIDERQFRDNVEALAARLKPSGYTYAVIDEGWYMVNPEDRPRPETLTYQIDEHSRFIAVPARFPASMEDGKNTGFAQLGRWVHAQGLEFGIHVIRGIPRVSVEKNAPIEGSSFRAQDAADQADACPSSSVRGLGR